MVAGRLPHVVQPGRLVPRAGHVLRRALLFGDDALAATRRLRQEGGVSATRLGLVQLWRVQRTPGVHQRAHEARQGRLVRPLPAEQAHAHARAHEGQRGALLHIQVRHRHRELQLSRLRDREARARGRQRLHTGRGRTRLEARLCALLAQEHLPERVRLQECGRFCRQGARNRRLATTLRQVHVLQASAQLHARSAARHDPAAAHRGRSASHRSGRERRLLRRHSRQGEVREQAVQGGAHHSRHARARARQAHRGATHAQAKDRRGLSRARQFGQRLLS